MLTLETIEKTLNINCDLIMTTALAAVLLLIGFWIKKKVPFLTKYCIPAPVIGGFLFMFISFAGHQTGAFAFNFNTGLQSPFMLAFFTTVGLGASVQLLKKGGILLVIYWLVACVVSIIQNFISVGLAALTGLEYPYALLAGAISMIGGHGAAGSYGSTFVEMGYPAGVTVGAAAATFGLIFGVLVGGPVARLLIEKNHLTPDESENLDTSVEEVNAAPGEKLSSLDVIKNVVAILACMAIGSQVSGWIGKLIGMSFPSYVGAMFIAMILRNLNEKFHWYNFSFPLVDGIGDVMLNLYLAIALMSLNLYQLLDLIGPVLLIVVAQVVVLILLCYFVVFRILGKNYDAAVMCAGLLGHGLGATPSAIVNMTAVKDKYGMSRKAFMIVPIVGAFLVDIIYQPQTIAFIKFFVQGFNG
ncbi:MAG: sodium/glutamate symporter [Oscillospiraceae bacterium]|nr:sodium/glutamate symporter [Oscillospiraceae bacterium]